MFNLWLLFVFLAFDNVLSTLTATKRLSIVDTEKNGLLNIEAMKMGSLVIANFNILNQDKLTQYSTAAALTLAKHGGEFIAKGKPSQLNGDSQYAMTAVIQFADKDTAITWYESPEYQEIIPLRDEGMESSFQLVG